MGLDRLEDGPVESQRKSPDCISSIQSGDF